VSAVRHVALDRLRVFLTLLVVAHHSVLAYARFGHFDPVHYLWSSAPVLDMHRWVGFDVFVLFNDSFFMAWMVLLSGLFVWPGLARHGAASYVRRRVWRLGVPFAMVVVLLMPLAYYPSFHLTGSALGLPAYWEQTLLKGPWPGGPAWFVWVLLLFDAAAAALWRWVPATARIVAALSERCRGRPLGACLVLLAGSGAAYAAMVVPFGPDRWFAFGPFAVQASRVLFYATYFAAGVVVGAAGMADGRLPGEDALARRWWLWGALALACFAALVAIDAIRLTDPAALPPAGWATAAAIGFVLCCAMIGAAVTALFLRFARGASNPLDRLRDDAYGIYLVHYVFVIWLQVEAMPRDQAAPLKAAIVFGRAFALSWGSVRILRRIPAVARIL
jgi:hypothetical protein